MLRILYNRHIKAGTKLTVNDLTRVVSDTIKSLNGKVYITLDTLDECPHEAIKGERSELLRFVKDVFSNLYFKLYLFITSRPKLDIGREISGVADYAFNIEELIKGDVKKYVTTVLERRDLASWGKEEKKKIREKLGVGAKIDAPAEAAVEF